MAEVPGTADAAPALEMSRVSKSFAGRAALSLVDLTIEAGQVRAVLGENGSGKSTLVKIVSGYHRPDPGSEIRVAGQLLHHGVSDAVRKAGARFVHQDLGLIDALSVQDNLSFGPGFPTSLGTIRVRSLRSAVTEDLARVGLDIDPRRLVGDLVPAEKTGIAVARALRRDGGDDIHLLVLDEPTATLPVREVASLLAMVRSVARQGIGVLYISHRLEEVFDVADAVTVLRDGRVVASEPVSGLSRPQLVTHLLGSEIDDTKRQMPPPPGRSGRVVLKATGLSAGQVSEADIEVEEGEVVGVTGITGSGREAVCQMIFGGLDRRSGEVYVDGRPIPAGKPSMSIQAGMVYIPADRKRSGLFMDMTVQDNLTISDLRSYWKKLILRQRRQRRDAAQMVDAYDVRPKEAVQHPIRTLSGGNQQKVLLAKWLRRSPNVLLLDEPTQGIDIGARASVHGHILRAATRGAAVVVSSADLDELAALCHRVLIFRNGRIAVTLHGSDVTAPALSRATLGSTS